MKVIECNNTQKHATYDVESANNSTIQNNTNNNIGENCFNKPKMK